MTLQVTAAGVSDVGQLRTDNEDMYLLAPDLDLYAVADGMGGHAAGEVASRLAVDALREVWSEEGGDEGQDERMQRGFTVANSRIREEVARNAARHGMGTTLVAARVTGEEAQIAHVGDSRAYLLRDGQLQQITRDHSWVREQIDLGRMSPEEAERHPFRNVITRALGTRSQVEVDLQRMPLQDGDRLLLCSDGLTAMLQDQQILAIALEAVDASSAVARLVAAANEAGGEDNITAVLLECRQG